MKNYNINNIKKIPYSIEAEQSVIGSLMIDNNKFYDILNIIDTDDFFIPNHKIIFNEMKLLINNNKPIDLITLSDSLNKKSKTIPGIFLYLSEISKNIPSIANVIHYSDIIKEKSIIRNIIYSINDISNICLNPENNNISNVIDIVESKLFSILNKNIKLDNNIKNIDKLLEKSFLFIKNMRANPKNVIGLSTGYYDLDKKTLGFQNSDLIIIAARPSMGKTTFAINICENISLLNCSKPILIFSLEMSSEQIMIKILSSLSKIEQSKIKLGKINNDDLNKISSVISIFNKNKNIYIDDSSSLTPYELRSKARKLFRESNGLSLIMIDYIQLITVPYLSSNRNMEITEISRSLKSLAKELNIPILVLSQLNRSLESRSDKRPINSDLRESGSIEQDADLVIFIYRDEIYNLNSNNKGIAEIIIGKHRNGPVGTIKLLFNSKLSRFENYINITNF